MNRENNIEAVQSATIPLPVEGKDMNSILKSLETGVENIFTGDKYAQYLQTMSSVTVAKMALLLNTGGSCS